MFLKKTGLEAAKSYFADNFTDYYRSHDVHGWNLSQGLYSLAVALEEMDARLSRLEKAILPPSQGQPRQK
jgi:hypothetical protein